MFEFRDPQYLYLAGIIPVAILLYIWSGWRTRRKLAKLGDKKLVAALTPLRSKIRPHVKFGLSMLILALSVVILARPQYGLKQGQETSSGIEVAVMMDVSNSMLAQDVTPSRLDRSKLLVSNLIDRMKNDKVALGVFAGEAYPQLPITTDFAAAKLFLDALNPSMVTMQGTNLGAAIELAQKSFTDNKNVGKAIILITDGEDHEEGAVEAAQQAAQDGMNIYVIGVGSPDGAEIPTANGPLRDNDGKTVRTALNEKMCREVAQAGKGIYLHLDQTNQAQEELRNQLSRLKQSQSSTTFTERDEQFQAVALIVLLLMIIEVCIMDTQNAWFKRFKLFKK